MPAPLIQPSSARARADQAPSAPRVHQQQRQAWNPAPSKPSCINPALANNTTAKGPDQLPCGISDCGFACFVAMACETYCPQFGALRLPPVLDEESQPVPTSPQRDGTSLNVTQLSLDHLQLDGGIVNELLGFHVTSHGTALTLR